uniref:RAB31, member RAS onco family n=1 Tax=Gallus gallus TaxID=9031 RepID=A0A8V0X962_CHICK
MMAIRELKVCLLGDTGVGKSSIVCRFVQDHFDHNISPTIGASFMTKTVPCGNELHKFLIWDTAGQERFHSLAPMYYRGSAAAVIVYDITKQDSFHTLKKWVKELKEHGPENIVMAIAGNKCDLSDIREVPMKDAKEYAESIGAIVVETSAKNAVNIEELFQGIMIRTVCSSSLASWCWLCRRLLVSSELAAGLGHAAVPAVLGGVCLHRDSRL